MASEDLAAFSWRLCANAGEVLTGRSRHPQYGGPRLGVRLVDEPGDHVQRLEVPAIDRPRHVVARDLEAVGVRLPRDRQEKLPAELGEQVRGRADPVEGRQQDHVMPQETYASPAGSHAGAPSCPYLRDLSPASGFSHLSGKCAFASLPGGPLGRAWVGVRC